MTTLNISLPASMRKFVKEQVKSGGYSTASEYVRELIRKAEKDAGRAWLEGELLKGINSGPATPMTKQDWADIRREAKSRIARRKKI